MKLLALALFLVSSVVQAQSIDIAEDLKALKTFRTYYFM